jgi:NodT family efflux transporter outer membrane factor (OMF) lipoprotein
MPSGWKLRVGAVVLLTLAGGCTGPMEYVRNGFKVGPNYRQPPAPVADRWIDDGIRDPNITQITPAPSDHALWWQVFQDPVLDGLVLEAYRQNLTLRSACLRIVEARALRGIAVGEMFPQSQAAFGDYSRNAVSQNAANSAPTNFFDDWQTGASLAWELDFWGRFRRAIEAADAKLDASIANYDDVLVLMLSEVAQRYAEVRTAELRLKYAHENVRIQEGTLYLADLKYDRGQGKVTRLDPVQAQSNLWQTRATIPPLEATRRQAANQLAILLGMPPGAVDQRVANPQRRDIIPAAPPEVAVGIPADLLRRRPDIRRAEREAAAQCAQIGIAVSDLYPHFSITGTIFLDAARFEDLFKSGSLAGSVGPSFRWNLLNYGRLANNIRFQDAQFQQLVADYQNTVLHANAEAENALVGFLKAQQQVNCLRESADASREALALVQQQYDAGKADFNRVFNVQQTLTQQEDQLAVARGTVANNLILLYKALGGGWQLRLAQPGPAAGPANQGPPPADPWGAGAPPLPPAPPPAVKL